MKREAEELRLRLREERLKSVIRSAVKARRFSGVETLRQAAELIDFCIRRRRAHEKG